jgi:hypothetical protein
MSNSFTIEDLEAAIEHEYAPLSFVAGGETFVLRSLLRIGKKAREEVKVKLESMDGEDVSEDDQVEAMRTVFRHVTADNKGVKLLRILGDDLLLLMKLLERWSEATQPGEASDSPA